MPQKPAKPDIWAEIDRELTPVAAPPKVAPKVDVWADIDRELNTIPVTPRRSYASMADEVQAPPMVSVQAARARRPPSMDDLEQAPTPVRPFTKKDDPLDVSRAAMHADPNAFDQTMRDGAVRRKGAGAQLLDLANRPPRAMEPPAAVVPGPRTAAGTMSLTPPVAPMEPVTAHTRAQDIKPENFQPKLQRVLARMAEAGYPMTVASGGRSAEQQRKLFDQGRGAPGPVVTELDGTIKRSHHQSGTAADLAFLVNGQPSFDDKLPWDVLGTIAEEEGLTWGGKWVSLRDRPHVQLGDELPPSAIKRMPMAVAHGAEPPAPNPQPSILPMPRAAAPVQPPATGPSIDDIESGFGVPSLRKPPVPVTPPAPAPTIPAMRPVPSHGEEHDTRAALDVVRKATTPPRRGTNPFIPDALETPPTPAPAAPPTFAGEATRGLVSGLVGGPAEALAATGEALGLLDPSVRANVHAANRTLEPAVTADVFENPAATLGDPLWWAHTGGQVTGSVLSLMGAGGAGVKLATRAGQALKLEPVAAARLVQIGGPAAATLAETWLESFSAYATVRERGGSEADAGAAAAKVAAVNLPLLGATNLPLFNPQTKSRLLNAVFGGVLEGPLQEVPQQATTNYAVGDPLSQGLGTSLVVGSMAGAAFGGIQRPSSSGSQGPRLAQAPPTAPVAARPGELGAVGPDTTAPAPPPVAPAVAPVIPTATIPDSALSAFPDMSVADGGLIPLNPFTSEERQAFRDAGLIRQATTGDGETYEGVDPLDLWPLREARQREGAGRRETTLTPEGEASKARRDAARASQPIPPSSPIFDEIEAILGPEFAKGDTPQADVAPVPPTLGPDAVAGPARPEVPASGRTAEEEALYEALKAERIRTAENFKQTHPAAQPAPKEDVFQAIEEALAADPEPVEADRPPVQTWQDRTISIPTGDDVSPASTTSTRRTFSKGYDKPNLHERRELGVMLKEMENIPFTQRTMVKSETYRPDEWLAGSAGAEVFSDIKGSTRQAVSNAIQRVLDGKRATAIGERAIDVARQRLDESGHVSPRQLDPDAGDEPGRTYVDRTHDMTPEEATHERAFREAVENKTDRLVAEYRKRFGNVVDADKFKELYKPYAASDEARAALNRAIHKASSAGKMAVYRKLVQEAPRPGQTPSVTFIAGGPGSGKSTVTDNPAMKAIFEAEQVVVDGPLTNVDVANRMIGAAVDAGKSVTIMYVHRDPVTAWTDGVQRRTGRKPPLDYVIGSHVKGLEAIRALHRQWGDHPEVHFEILENQEGGATQQTTLDQLPEAYNEGDVRSAIEARQSAAPAAEGAGPGGTVATDGEGRSRSADGRGSQAPSSPQEVAPAPPAPVKAGIPVTPRAAVSDPLRPLIERYKPGNPFAKKAAFARARADQLNKPTAHERGMAESFPLGAGFGHGSQRSRDKKIDASINRSTAAVEASKNAEYLEAQAAAFDAGKLNAQGRRWDPVKQERSEKREAAGDKREERIAAAKATRGDKHQWQVPGSVWVDSTGNLGGGARKLLLGEHREAVEAALADGKDVPADVLAEYPDLAKPTTDAAPTLQPYSPKAMQEAFNLTPAQAAATDALVQAMGLDTSKIEVVKGGLPGDGALTQQPTDSPAFKAWFRDSKVVDANGQPLQVFHGTQRLDRFGPILLKKRATSGPMPFFTEDPVIASNYAKNKQDTSLSDEDVHGFESYFRLKVGRGKPVNLDRAWWQLSPEQRASIAKLAPRVTQTDGAQTIVLAEEGHNDGLGGYDQHIKETRGNHFAALIEEWLNSATLFNDERAFETVLKLAGAPMDQIEFHDPHAEVQGVVPVYLSIQKPLVTDAIPDAVLARLSARANRARVPVTQHGADAWDKSTRDPKHWIAQLKEDLAKGENSFVWSSIPDWVTAELTAAGYDGIKDTGGKMGGDAHVVWIPFNPGQVKSSVGNRGTYDGTSPNILKQLKPKQSDLLDTGEEQGRLPGAEAVREQETPTPEFDRNDDFRITGELVKRKGQQDTLFQENAPFYSRLQRAVESATLKKASGQQWKGLIKNAKGGINLGEFAFAHVDDLEDGKTYTKSEVLAYLAANELKVEPVILGNPDDSDSRMDAARANLKEKGYTVDDDNGYLHLHNEKGRPVATLLPNGDRVTKQSAEVEDKDEWDEAPEAILVEFDNLSTIDRMENEPHYSRYQEPGGDDGSYREVLLTVPALPHDRTLEQIAQARFNKPFTELTDAQQNAAVKSGSRLWYDGHDQYSDHKNPIVRLRFNVRSQTAVIADGPEKGVVARTGRTMFLEEVQPPSKDNQKKMPELLRKNWREIGFKWALRYAAENGLDAVAWTTGEMQAARYSLEKEVDSIGWHQRAGARDGVKTVTVHTYHSLAGGHKPTMFDVLPTGVVSAHGFSLDGRINGKPLADVVGKAIADKILREDKGGLKGDGLKIGGEGLKKLYDVDFPNVVKNLPAVKRAGVKVEPTVLKLVTSQSLRLAQTPDGEWTIWDPITDDYHMDTATTNPRLFASREKAEAWLKDQGQAGGLKRTVPSIAITPQLREAVMGGQPLFQAAYHGSPHKFEQFSLHHIGTGEGAQAYGWGMYFSGKRAVADEYRRRLAGTPTGPTVQFKGRDLFEGADTRTPPNQRGLFYATEDKQIRSGLSALWNRVKASADIETLPEIRTRAGNSAREIERMLDAGGTFSGNERLDRGRVQEWKDIVHVIDTYEKDLTIAPSTTPGRTYKVEIPEDEDYLDWDKPASQQSEKVQVALTALGIEWTPVKAWTPKTFLRWTESKVFDKLWREDIGIRAALQGGITIAESGDAKEFQAWFLKHQELFPKGAIDPTGESLYGKIGIKLSEDPFNRPAAARAESTSRALAAHGVAGIRYLDGASRGKGDGSHNYVVFDDKLVQVMEYDQGAKGAVEFMVDGKALIRGFAAADVSSGIHELAHVARRQLFDWSVPADKRHGITDEDIRTAERWAGADTSGRGTVWTVAAEEKFARGFERYLRDGDAPNKELKSIFAKFADWLRDIYKKLKGSEIDIHISKAMRQTFDRLVTRGQMPVTPRKPSGSSGGTLSMPSGKGPYSGLPTQPKGTIPVTDRMRPSAIIEKLRKGLGDIPVNVGRFRQQALGIYKVKPHAVRVKVANDLQTVAHELGHHIDHAILGISYKDARWRDELQALGQATSRPSYSVKQQREEGAAEFLRQYLIEPAAVQADAPVYYAEFERRLDDHKDLKTLLHEAREDLAGLIAQDYATRGTLRIDFTGKDSDSIYQRLKDDPKGAIRNLATLWIDDLHALRVAVDEMADARPLDARANAYVLARNARGTGGMAEGFLAHGVRARNGRFVSGSFADAIAPVKEHLQEFAGYLVARRVIEVKVLKRKETGMSSEEAAAIIKKVEQGPHVEAMQRAADNVYAYQQGLLQYAREYHALSQEQFDTLLTEGHYVPLQRVMDSVSGAFSGGGARKIANRNSPIKRMKGSGRDIVNPLESIIRNTFAIVDMVEKNRAAQALFRQAEKSAGSAKWLEIIPPGQVGTKFNLAQIQKDVRAALEDAGVDVPDNLDLDALVTVFTPQQFALPGSNVITVMRDGKRVFAEVHEQALFDAVTAIGGQASSTLIEWASKPAALVRAGATLTPGFIARNPTRDTLVAFMQSRYGFIPVYDTIRGFMSAALGEPEAKLFFTSGVQQSSLVGADRDRLRKQIRQMGTKTKAEFFKNIALHPIDLLRAISENMESATRLGEFRLAIKAAGQERRTGVLGIAERLTTKNTPQHDDETLARATLAARDVTTDFSRGGSLAKEVSRVKAFFNARVQGYVRMIETAQRDPVGTALNVTLLAMLSYALWWAHEDEDEYDEIPDWEKSSYWHIPTGKGYIKVAKPFEWAYVANVTEAALSHIRKQDPTALNRIRPAQDPKQLAFALIPSALTPILEASFNYDTFRDTYIVKPWDVGLDPEQQKSDWTTDTAIGLGKIMGISPAKVDHVIFGYGAGFARGVVEHGTDRALGLLPDSARNVMGIKPRSAEPDKKWQRVPVAGTFYREGSFDGGSQSLRDFYKAHEHVTNLKASLSRYAKTDIARGRERITEAQKADWFRRQVEIVEAKAALEDLGKDINAIYAAPMAKMSPQQKRQALDKTYEKMVSAAREALGKRPLHSATGTR